MGVLKTHHSTGWATLSVWVKSPIGIASKSYLVVLVGSEGSNLDLLVRLIPPRNLTYVQVSKKINVIFRFDWSRSIILDQSEPDEKLPRLLFARP